MKNVIQFWMVVAVLDLVILTTSRHQAHEFKFEPHQYQAEVVSVYDADTLTLKVDLGFHVTVEEKFRLHRINGWEVRGYERQKGVVARDWLRKQIPDGSAVYIKTVKDSKGKYGRYLCDLFVQESDGGYRCLNDQLVELGHAKYQDY